VGSLLAAFLTEYLNPHYSFLICGILGIGIVTSSFRLNKALDIKVDNRFAVNDSSNGG
jgi:hypothetical protein